MEDSSELTSNLRYWDVDHGVVSTEAITLSQSEKREIDGIRDKLGGFCSLEEALDYLFEAGSQLFPCDRLAVAFTEDGQHRIVSHWVKARYAGLLLVKDYREDLHLSSLKRVIEENCPRVIGDLEEYLKHNSSSHSTQLLLKEGVRSSMTCPLSVEGRPVGVLFRSSRTAWSYGKKEVFFHQLMAGRLSQVVDKFCLIKKLQEANQAYRELIGFVSHELKSPVAAIIFDSESIRQGYLGPVPTDIDRVVEKIHLKASYLLKMTRDYLDFSRIESSDLSLNIKNDLLFCQDIVNPALEFLQSEWQPKEIRIEKMWGVEEELITVAADGELLRIVFHNLLSNAIKYAFPKALVRLEMGSTPTGFRFCIWNEGPGFLPENQTKLFSRFSRLQEPALLKSKGTGLGLYTCWRIIQAHGGRIEAQSEPGRWAAFSLFLPHPAP